MIATVLILMVLFMRLGVSLAFHGKERPREKGNFFLTFIWVCVCLWVYYSAGLFDKFIE